MSKNPIDWFRCAETSPSDLFVVPVSGGKDSQLCLSLAVEAFGKERIIAIHNYTGIDHPLTYEHLKWMEEFYGVPIEFTSNSRYKDIWDLMDQRMMIPGRTSRACTTELKIIATNQWLDAQKKKGVRLERLVFLMGVRAPESQQRQKRYSGLTHEDEFSLCDMNPKRIPKRYAMVRARVPIVEQTTPWVFQFMRERNERLNPLYAKGHKRVGCFPCVLSGQAAYRLSAREPVGRETIIKLRDFKAILSGYRPDIPPEWIVEHDLDQILADADNDPFGFYEDDDDELAGGCQWCAM